MIEVTDATGKRKFINCDMIERIDIIPETLLVVTNGHNLIVKESPEEVVRRIVVFRRDCNAPPVVTDRRLKEEPTDA